MFVEKIKKILKASVFVTIFFIIFLTVQQIMTPKWRDSADAETEKFGFYYSLPKNTIDYIMLGTSPSFINVNIPQIYAETGITGYTLGTGRQSAKLSYYWLEEALKTQSPSIVFWEVSPLLRNSVTDADITRAIVPMKFSLNKLRAIKYCKKNTQTFSEILFPIIQFHSRWDSLGKEDFNSNIEDMNYYLYGSYITFNVNPSTNKDRGYIDYSIYEYNDHSFQAVGSVQPTVQDDAKYYFEKMLKLCEKNEVQLIPVKLPVMRWSKEQSKCIENYLDQYGIELLDLTDNPNIPMVWAQDTGDNGYHLNYWGTSKVSHYIANFLKNREIKGHKGDEKYSEYDDNLLKYQQYEQDNLWLLWPYDTYNYIDILSENKEKYFIIISIRDEGSDAWNSLLEASMHRLGIKSTFFGQEQNSFVGIIDAGESIFEKWDDHQITVNADFLLNNTNSVSLSVSSAGLMCGNISSIMVNNTEYSLNNRGLNIVVIDKLTCNVISSVSIDSHSGDLALAVKNLSNERMAAWQEVFDNSQLVKDGIYYMSVPYYSGYNIAIVNNEGKGEDDITLCAENDGAAETFEISYIGNGLYTIRSLSSNKYLSANTGGGNGCNLQNETGLANQIWFIMDNDNGSHSVISLYNSCFLGIEGEGKVTGIGVYDEQHVEKIQTEFVLKRVP